MTKKKKVYIAAAVLLLLFIVIFKYPKTFEKIIPEPYTFENNGVHICIGVGVAETEENIYLKECRVLFSTDEGHGKYEEIHSIFEKAKFIADIRNLVPFDSTDKNYNHYHGNKGVSINFENGEERFCVEIHRDGCVRAYEDYHPGVNYIYTYRLKDTAVFDEIWDYIVENGEVYINN